MNFSQGHSGTKVQCEPCLFSQGKTPEFTKMGEIHELFVLTLFLVWFAGATPDFPTKGQNWSISGVLSGGPKSAVTAEKEVSTPARTHARARSFGVGGSRTLPDPERKVKDPEASFQEEIIYAPPPPPPPFGQKTFFQGEGRGGVILKPPTAGFYTPPLFYTPPPLEFGPVFPC